MADRRVLPLPAPSPKATLADAATITAPGEPRPVTLAPPSLTSAASLVGSGSVPAPGEMNRRTHVVASITSPPAGSSPPPSTAADRLFHKHEE